MSLPKGIPALLLLIAMNVMVVSIGSAVYKKGLKWYLLQSSASIRAATTFAIATPFWIWAVIKVVSDGVADYGAISFLLVMISCFTVHCQSSSKEQRCPCILLFISNLLVLINYLLPFFIISFHIYLYVGSVYWAILCWWNWSGYKQGDDSHIDSNLFLP